MQVVRPSLLFAARALRAAHCRRLRTTSECTSQVVRHAYRLASFASQCVVATPRCRHEKTQHTHRHIHPPTCCSGQCSPCGAKQRTSRITQRCTSGIIEQFVHESAQRSEVRQSRCATPSQQLPFRMCTRRCTKRLASCRASSHTQFDRRCNSRLLAARHRTEAVGPRYGTCHSRTVHPVCTTQRSLPCSSAIEVGLPA